MSRPNGHANGSAASRTDNPSESASSAVIFGTPVAAPLPPERIKELVGELEVPFDPSVIEWRITNTTRGDGPLRGQVIPYADQRAYTDRLNALFTPAGWTRRYAVHTSANFQRSKDQKVVAKVFNTCELTIFGLGSHSATGEEWIDGDNAGTSAEAQAFKRACSCFGLGRYLYYFSGVWVDVDGHKRPKTVPKLPEWATPAGWQRGLRPSKQGSNGHVHGNGDTGSRADSKVMVEIESMQEKLGARIYRGLLKTLARVWTPREIQDLAVQQRVLLHMQAAERGLHRAAAAMNKVGEGPFNEILQSLNVKSSMNSATWRRCARS